MRYRKEEIIVSRFFINPFLSHFLQAFPNPRPFAVAGDRPTMWLVEVEIVAYGSLQIIVVHFETPKAEF